MTQEPEHQLSKCPKCRAGRNEPCVTTDGREAERVHYGRPFWSSKVIRPWQRQKEMAEPEVYVEGGWGPCDECRHWMLRGSGLPVTCVICRSAA